MQIRFPNSLFVHESWVDVKTVQELHSQSFHPRFLGSKRAPAWALTFLWLVRATSEPACHRNNQTYYSETHCQQASGWESKRVQIWGVPLLIKWGRLCLGKGGGASGPKKPRDKYRPRRVRKSMGTNLKSIGKLKIRRGCNGHRTGSFPTYPTYLSMFSKVSHTTSMNWWLNQ